MENHAVVPARSLRSWSEACGIALLAGLCCLPAPPRARADESSAPPVYAIGDIESAWRGHPASFDEIALSPDGRQALTGDHDHNVVLWDARRGEVIRVLKGHRANIFCAAFSPDGRRALSGSGDGTLRLWDLGDGKLLREIAVGGEHVLSVAFSADGGRAVTGDESGGVKLWRLSDGRLLRDYGLHQAPALSVGFVDGDRSIVATDFDDRVRIVDVASGRDVASFHPAQHKPAVKGFVSRDGRRFLVIGDALELRDAATGALLKSLPQGSVTGDLGTRVAFSRDGRYVLAECDHQRLNLWDTQTGRLLRQFIPPGHARTYVFSADGSRALGVFGGVDAVVVWPLTPPAGTPARPEGPPPSAGSDARAQALVALGQLLIFDPRLSRDGTVSCTTCHNPQLGWTDGRPVEVGIAGRRGTRNTQTLLNAGLHSPLFWDGRAKDLEDQVHFPLEDPVEMGWSIAQAARRLSTIAGYRDLFSRAFGDPAVTPKRMAAAIAAFERTLVSLDSPYDRYAAGDRTALSPAATRGLDLFRTKGRCFACHELETSRHRHQMFLDIGLPQHGDHPDLGRGAIVKTEDGGRAFAVPDLHNLKYTAPYMHDGSLKTLADVVDFYDAGGGPDPNKSPWILPLHLTAAEKKDLIAFLESLSGDPLAQKAPQLPR